MDDVRGQNAKIREYLEQGHWLSPLDAVVKFHCLRLGARIYDIKGELAGTGKQVVTRTKTLSSGKRVAEYTVPNREAT